MKRFLIGAAALAFSISAQAQTLPPVSTNATQGYGTMSYCWDPVALAVAACGSGHTNAVQGVTGGVPLSTAASAPHAAISTTLTTPAGVTYTGATTAAPLAVCANASGTICAPITVTISATQVNSGSVTRILLQKSTTTATGGAQFRVDVFETAPTMTGIYDATAYTIPAVDVLSRAYVGTWECPQAEANLETFECSAHATNGYNAFQVTAGKLYFVVKATAPYVRPTGETFTVLADVYATVP